MSVCRPCLFICATHNLLLERTFSLFIKHYMAFAINVGGVKLKHKK